MSFWTENSLEPKRAYRFRIKGGSIGLGSNSQGTWWNVKKVDKPSFTINSNKYRLINHEINVPGIVSWNPITIELADVGKTIDAIIDELNLTGGYNPRNLALDGGIAKGQIPSGTLLGFMIEQLNGNGDVIEQWMLEGAFVSEVRLSSLDYGSDDIISITLTITYDYAYLEEPEKQ